MNSPNLKSILNYRNHPYVISVTHFCNQASSLNFSSIGKNKILKEIKCLSTNKVTQDTDLTLKTLHLTCILASYLQFQRVLEKLWTENVRYILKKNLSDF